MIKTSQPKLKQQLGGLSKKPGSYIFRDKGGLVLYVGKANNLRSRVLSYFRKNADLTPAKIAMVKKIADLETIVVASELEALILEATLIKKYRPHYNVLLKDDKHYLFIKITTNEDFPKVMTVRRISKDRARYFGPFTSSQAVRDTLNLLQKIFPYRTCTLDLVRTGASNKNFRPCLRYHLGRCDAPCAQKISAAAYGKIIDKIVLFLEGRLGFVMQDLEKQMGAAADRQDFERAANLRDQISTIKQLTKKQVVLSPKFTSQDVVGFVTNQRGDKAFATILKIREGRLLAKENFVLHIPPDSPAEEIVRALILHHYQSATFFPRDLVLPIKLHDSKSIKALFEKRLKSLHLPNNFKITQASKGTKKGLLALAEENALEYRAKQNLKKLEKPHQDFVALKKLSKALGLAQPARRVEIYDISNTQGVAPVGSMVVFSKGQPDKAEYRRFKIKDLAEQPNDVGMLAEVLRRRLKRVLSAKESWPQPDLIIVDGGKPQLNAALKVKDQLDLEIPLAALAKKEELLFTPGSQKPLRLAKDSPALFLVQRMRDEAHRFAITFHRRLRNQRGQRSLLDEIRGIGPKRKKLLLQKYGSLQAISLASETELDKLIGQKAATALMEQLAK